MTIITKSKKLLSLSSNIDVVACVGDVSIMLARRKHADIGEKCAVEGLSGIVGVVVELTISYNNKIL